MFGTESAIIVDTTQGRVLFQKKVINAAGSVDVTSQEIIVLEL